MGSLDDGATVKAKAAEQIIDIRSDAASFELKQEITAGLKPEKEKENGEKRLPTLLLYDDAGLKLFERITYLEEYYLTGDEIEVLTKNANSIADQIPDNSMIVELGSGNLRKVNLLLSAVDKTKKHVSYYALDLMRSELERTLNEVPAYEYVKCFGLHGTYDDGFEFLKKPENAAKPKTILSLGSSIGNFPRDDAAKFLKQYIDLLGVNDRFLIGVDASEDPDKVYHAYNDREGVTHAFILNGLEHANRLLGYDAFDLSKWHVVGEYDAKNGKHRAYVVADDDIVIDGVQIRKGERVNIEESYKYNSVQMKELLQASGAKEASVWTNQTASYGLHLLQRRSSGTMYPTKATEYASHPVPSVEDWKQLWANWDLVTREMIPEEELHSKPIDLRNACIFYLGHIPTFFDIKIVEATGAQPTEPSYFYKIFERGIDPDVDNPDNCHAHSEIPDTWPELGEILLFQARLRERVLKLYETGQAYEDQWTGRAMWLGFEHEIMHLETLLYMLLQSDKTRSPPGTKPDFAKLAAEAKRNAVDNEWFDVPEQTISLGIDDPDNGEGPVRYFGWDIEKPARSVKVGAVKAKARPITNEEYARYLCAIGSDCLPTSWMIATQTNGTLNDVNGHVNGDDGFSSFLKGKAVRTVYGPVPLEYALHWPVSASYDELHGCAKYMGGRIPTHEEAQSIYAYADALKQKEATNALGETIPAVNGHLSNNGVQETPPSKPSVNGASAARSAAAGLDPNDLHVNLDDANVGFHHWHPMPVTQNGGRLAGRCDMGGLWEHTSSKLERQKGFTPMKLYPAFSEDFFDGKHNIVLGGSWATHPRLAGRTSFVNWYQPNYRYAWAGARLVQDV